MEFDGEVVRFNIFEAMRCPSDVHSCFSIDVLDVLAQQILELESKDALDLVIRNNLEHIPQPTTIKIDDDLKETVASLETLPRLPTRYAPTPFVPLALNHEKMLPSVLHAPSLELKPLPEHVKYVYLGKNETLPVIIANNLSAYQEEQLIMVLVEHRTAIGWTIADIKGISPSL